MFFKNFIQILFRSIGKKIDTDLKAEATIFGTFRTKRWGVGIFTVFCAGKRKVNTRKYRRLKRPQPADYSAGCGGFERLYIKIEEEFVRMGTKPHVIDLIFGLVFDPPVDDILGKNIPFEKKLLICL